MGCLNPSSASAVCLLFFFFFQAEDGIRDYKVTGVQTCALPISASSSIDEGSAMGKHRPAPNGRGPAGKTSAGQKAPSKSRRVENDVFCGHVRDRKSTRLNSSHLVISYAVFCLKKKKKR